MTTITLIPVVAGQEMPVERVGNLDGLFSRMATIAELHKEKLHSLKENWDDDEQNTRVGYSIDLGCDRADSRVTLHAIDEGCVLMGKVGGRLRVSRGSLESSGIVAFLHPEWLEFELSELTSHESAKEILHDWLATGVLKEEYLR